MAGHGPDGTASRRGTSGCCAPRGVVGLGARGWWLLPGSACGCRDGDILCGEQLGQLHARVSTRDGSVVAVDGVLGCPVSPLWPAAMLAHAAREGLRTVTMASSLGTEVAVARGVISVLAVGRASGAVWGSTEDGQGTQTAGELEVAGRCRVAGDTGWPGDAGQPACDSWRAQDGRGLTQRPDPVTACAGDVQGVGHQPLRLGMARALLQSCPAPLLSG